VYPVPQHSTDPDAVDEPNGDPHFGATYKILVGKYRGEVATYLSVDHGWLKFRCDDGGLVSHRFRDVEQVCRTCVCVCVCRSMHARVFTMV
jgi:hypothetical protein